MSEPILKSYVDERGNISVRVSHDVQVLTREEADRIEAEYKRMQAENAKLRKILADACTYLCLVKMSGPLAVEIDDQNVYWDGEKILDRMLDLGVEVDDA